VDHGDVVGLCDRKPWPGCDEGIPPGHGTTIEATLPI
jgi:hypothetical protein